MGPQYARRAGFGLAIANDGRMPAGALLRELHRIATAAEHPHAVLRMRLVAVIGASYVVDAVFWTTAQLLTVSSQMPNPLTTAGRILDLGLELYALVVITSVAGMFASFLTHRERDRRRA